MKKRGTEEHFRPISIFAFFFLFFFSVSLLISSYLHNGTEYWTSKILYLVWKCCGGILFHGKWTLTYAQLTESQLIIGQKLIANIVYTGENGKKKKIGEIKIENSKKKKKN